LGAAIAVLVISNASAQTPTGSISFLVTKGDTYINLFGPGWEKAYRQNKVTLMRAGRAVSSPDILVEGSILTVTSDVDLTRRASSRVQALQQRRVELQARLEALAPKFVSFPEAQRAVADCLRLLESVPQFAADVEFADREVSHLERLARNRSVSLPVRRPASSWWIILVGVVALVLASSIFWRRKRAMYPEGAARYHEALADVQAAVRRVGVDA
jgi:LPXTG-motif cell wall-anchored protein